jgi:valyl-tRNA synthetase
MATRELPKAYDPTEIEPRWYKFWLEHDLFHADTSIPKLPYSIVIPPPNVTGSLHMGHALGFTIQDVLVRWHRMRGANAMWLPGSDHAGISTQIMVERDLQKTEQKSRHDLGREAFVARVWAWKDKYGGRIVEQMKAMGFSLDWARMRFTLDDGLSAAVREVFVRLYDEGLIYRARRLINWCTKDQTALSDLEVDANEEQGSIWEIRYGELVVATTRPETMLGDTAVAVHPDDPRYKHLIGKTVRLPLTERDIPIIADPILVDMEFGTGAVKVTPGHDFNDFETGLRHNLEQLSIIDATGKLQAPAPAKYVGMTVPEARKAVLADLEAAGLLVATKPHKLSIGRCERCGTIAEPLLSMQWFVKAGVLAGPAIEAVEQGKTKFVPELWTKTYMHWMRNIKDWCISRQLWWGHQIPAWYCPDGHVTVARSAPSACQCGKTELRQDDDVLDTWFSSALWPFSTLGWPEQTRELKTFYPTNVLVTAKDIIFFWVARMMMMGLHFMKKVPFHHVYITALVVDENGEKMSKMKGNVIDPLDVAFGAKKEDLLAKVDLPDAKKRIEKAYPEGMEAMGVDGLRYALSFKAIAGRDLSFKLTDARSIGKEFVNKIWNSARFVLMNVEGFDAEAWADAPPPSPETRTLADRWILSRLQRVTAEVNRALEEYRLDEAAQALYNFFWGEYCDWYVEVAKPALQGSDDAAKRAAQGTLVTVIETSMRLFHPFMPFVTEEIWQALPKASVHAGSSIMTTLFPEADESLIDADAETRFGLLTKVVVAIRNVRAEFKISPKEVMEVRVKGDKGVLADGRGIVERTATARLVLEGAEAAKGMARVVIGTDLELLIPLGGFINLATEKARLLKEVEKAEKSAADAARQLQNQEFIAKAPADKVEGIRQRLADESTKAQRLREAAQLLES